MLTPDLVRARRRAGELRIVPLSDVERERGAFYAEQLILAARGCVGLSREEFDGAVAATNSEGLERRLKDGLVKLILDRCDVETDVGGNAPKLRAAIFSRAATARMAGTFDRDAILTEVAQEFALEKSEVERGMYGDLRSAHILRGFETTTAEGLVREYEEKETEAVLLRATRLAVHLDAPQAGAARLFFRRIKFLGLLCTIERPAPPARGYTVTIDGPLSLFEASTSYGLKLALVTRMLDGCGPFSLVADILWGREREPLVFRARGETAALPSEDPPLSDEVTELVLAWGRQGFDWTVEPTAKVLHLPGVGMSIPDLVFSRDGMEIYLEVMGYWSRAAVWRRVELVEAGLAASVLFAVNQKLRVSEDVLPEDAPSSLYVFKRGMSPRVIAEKLNAIAKRAPLVRQSDEAYLDALTEPKTRIKRTRSRKKRTGGGEPAT